MESLADTPPKTAFCVSTSSKVLILDSLRATQTRVPLLAVPRYCTLVGSNSTSAFSSSSGPMIGARHDGGDHGAVLGRDGGEEAGGAAARRARHVLGDDAGLARDVLPVMPGQRAGVDVVAAGRRRTDEQVDRLAGVEIGG